MASIVRFAPSPTGFLHVGNLRSALVNWLFARACGGEFVLRMDDTDPERSTAEYAAAIEEDLRWLGLDWDRLWRQSERSERYRETVEHLKETGRLYACYETAEELETKRKLLLARHKPPVYDRTGLRLGDDEKQALEDQGRRPHWRFLLDPGEVHWDDLVRGASHIDTSSLSDPVLLRSDGRPLYMLPSAVDDMDLGVTHVLRGEDHVTNTAEQIQIFAALGAKHPAFGHFPLLADTRGEGLSKREGALGLRALRGQGYEPMALLSLVAKLGTSDPVEPRQTLDELVAEFDLSRFSRNTARFDRAELAGLNARLLHGRSFEAVAGRLGELGLEGADAAFWETVRPNLAFLGDAAEWWHVVHGSVTPLVEDAELLDLAAGLLPEAPWDETTWGLWTAALADASGKKGRALYHPLRLALTGLDRGPEMKNLLPLVGPERARGRLNGETV